MECSNRSCVRSYPRRSGFICTYGHEDTYPRLVWENDIDLKRNCYQTYFQTSECCAACADRSWRNKEFESHAKWISSTSSTGATNSLLYITYMIPYMYCFCTSWSHGFQGHDLGPDWRGRVVNSLEGTERLWTSWQKSSKRTDLCGWMCAQNCYHQKSNRVSLEVFCANGTSRSSMQICMAAAIAWRQLLALIPDKPFCGPLLHTAVCSAWAH